MNFHIFSSCSTSNNKTHFSQHISQSNIINFSICDFWEFVWTSCSVGAISSQNPPPPNKHPTVTRSSISQPWWVPFTLQLHFSIKSTASLQGWGTGILSSVTLNAVWKYHHLLKRGGDIVTLHKSSLSCSPKHCALVSIVTDLYRYSTPTVCRSCVFSKGQGLCDLSPTASCSYLSVCLLGHVIPHMKENAATEEVHNDPNPGNHGRNTDFYCSLLGMLYSCT